MNEIHAPLARAIRDGVRLRYSTEIQEMLRRGGEVFMNGGEADDAAHAALDWLGANGYTIVPNTALRPLVDVAAHVSRGRSSADVSPYPDSTARRALGALDEAGVLADLDAWAQRRRGLLAELTREAVDAGTYGEPAPDMRDA